MSTFYLIRHGLNDFVGQAVAGWTPGVHLNEKGRAQAERLAVALAEKGIDRIFSSPLERARETAEPLARLLGLPVELRDSLGEVRYGDWTGQRFDDLERDPRWRLYGSYRSGTRAPGGELMLESQMRIVNELEALRIEHPADTIAVVTHGDVMRAALVYYLGMPLDFFHRIAIQPASFTVLQLSGEGPRILRLNAVAE